MKMWLCVITILLCARVAWAQPPGDSPDVPRNDPAYADLTIIYDSALIECVYGLTGKLLPMTRYEFAVAIARLVQNVPLIRAGQTPSRDKDLRVNTALARLLVQFAPELGSLGISRSDLDSRHILLTGKAGNMKNYAIVPPFNDVPPDHWAFNAVEQLRLNGIIVGQAACRTDAPMSKKPNEQGQQR